MFDAQAWYARDVIMGRIKLPSKEEMAKDDDLWVKREEALKDAFEKIDFQGDYVRDLCAATDYPKFDIDMTVDEFKQWEHDKEHQSWVTATGRSNRPAPGPWRRSITRPGSRRWTIR